jgi:hypothetical protein
MEYPDAIQLQRSITAMSLPVENLTCSKCGDKCDVRTWRPEPTEALYLPGGYVAPVLKRKEWCAKCLRRVSASNVPSSAEIDKYLTSLTLDGNEEDSDDDQIESERLLLNRLFVQGKSAWKEWSERQPFRGYRCACGAQTSPMESVNEKSEAFVHPNCGGILRWKESEDGLRFAWRQPDELQVRFIDAKGETYREATAARELLLQLFDELDRKPETQSPFGATAPTLSTGNLSIHKNPFSLLCVSTRDGRKLIVERAEERSLAADPASCQQARSELTNPRTRLAAEISWLPGVSPRRATALLNSLTADPFSVRREEGIPTLAHCNLMASAFEAVSSNHSAADVAAFVEQFARQVDELDAEVVLRSVNEDRAISGFPEVKGAELVQEEIAQRKRSYRNAVKEALNQLPPNDLIGAMTRVLESTTANGTRHAPELIDELVDSYAVETQQFLQQEAENAEKLIGAARSSASKGDAGVKSIIDQLERVLRNWDKVAQPLQLSFKARGIEHNASKTLAYKVRSLAVDFFNEHDNLSQSRRLTQLLKELFSEVPEIVDLVDEDAKALGDISARREESSAINPIRTLCDEVSKSADRNPSSAQYEGQRLLDEGKALIKALPIKATSPTYLEARDMLAATLMHCAVAYGNQTSKWEPCIQLLQAALGMVNDSKLKRKLQENLTIVEGNYKSLGDLESIKSAPSLYTINGFGVTLYGNTDKSPSDGSYMATYYLVFFFVPVLPLARYRVIPTGSGYRFLGKGPLRVFDKWHIAISLGLIALMFLKG